MYSFSWLIMSCLKRNYRGSSNLTKSSKFKIIVKKVKRNLKVQIFILVWGVHEVNLKLPGSNMKRKVSNMFIWKKKNWLLKIIMMLSELTFTDQLPNISGIVLTSVLVQIHCVLPIGATFSPILQVRKLRLIEVK